MGENEGAAPAAPDPAVALVIPVIVIVDLTEFAKWQDGLYAGAPDDPAPDPEAEARAILDEAVGVFRHELEHVDGISIGYGPSDLVDDAPDGL